MPFSAEKEIDEALVVRFQEHLRATLARCSFGWRCSRFVLLFLIFAFAILERRHGRRYKFQHLWPRQ